MAAFEMSEEDVAQYKTTRQASESPYTADVANAVKNPGKVFGLFIADENRSSRSIVNNLIKAANAAKVKLHIQVREKAEKPVVIFRLAPAAPAAENGKTDATPTA
jgi:hypothetical protein